MLTPKPQCCKVSCWTDQRDPIYNRVGILIHVRNIYWAPTVYSAPGITGVFNLVARDREAMKVQYMR